MSRKNITYIIRGNRCVGKTSIATALSSAFDIPILTSRKATKPIYEIRVKELGLRMPTLLSTKNRGDLSGIFNKSIIIDNDEVAFSGL